MDMTQVWVVTEQPAWLLRADRIVSLFIDVYGSEDGPRPRPSRSGTELVTDVSLWAEVAGRAPVCLDRAGDPRHAGTDLADLVTALGEAARVGAARGAVYVARTGADVTDVHRTRWEMRSEAPVELFEIDLWGGLYEQTQGPLRDQQGTR